MKNITKALGIAGIVGASFLPLKSEGQDFINCKKYNPIQNNLFYSIESFEKPPMKYIYSTI